MISTTFKELHRDFCFQNDGTLHVLVTHISQDRTTLITHDLNTGSLELSPLSNLVGKKQGESWGEIVATVAMFLLLLFYRLGFPPCL